MASNTRTNVMSHPLQFTSEVESFEDQQDDVEHAKFLTLKEIIPGLDDAVIFEILKGNKYDIEKSIDAALALSTSLSNESGSAVLSTTSRDSFGAPAGAMRRFSSVGNVLSPIERPPSIDTRRLADNADDLTEIQPGPVAKYTGGVSNRGTVLILPNKFLVAPRFRYIVTHDCEYYLEYSVAFRRKNEKLGVTIQEVNSCEMSIVNLHYKNGDQSEPLLAMQAGVQVGDILTGINNEYFSPVVDVEDVLDVLRLSGSFVTLHFRRKYKIQPKEISEFHKSIRYLLDNNVIVQEQVRPIDSIICRLKEKTLNWSDAEVAERVVAWKLDPLLYKKVGASQPSGSLFFDRFAGVMSVPQKNRARANSSQQAALQRPVSSRRSIGGVDEAFKKPEAPSSSGTPVLNRRNSTGAIIGKDATALALSAVSLDDNAVKIKLDTTAAVPVKSPNGNDMESPVPRPQRDLSGTAVGPSLRPALSFRIMNAEDQAFDYIAYVVWVTDVVSGVEWVVRKRYKEFFELREVSDMCCHPNSLIFVQQIIALRPAVEKIDFPPKGFAVSESTIIVEERLRGLQKFLYRIVGLVSINALHPSTVRIALLLQRFLFVDDHQDLIDAALGESSPALRCTQMAQVFIHDAMHLQCMDKVVVRFIDNYVENQSVDLSRDWTEREGDRVCQELKVFLEHVQNFLCDAFYDDCRDIVARYNSKSGAGSGVSGLLSSTAAAVSSKTTPRRRNSMSEEERALHEEVLVLLSEDEQRSLIRSAIRRQVEIEVYVGCSSRLTYVLQRCFFSQENALRLKIAHIINKPQSFYGIPTEHQSPSRWACIVNELRDIRGKTLPSDRIDWLVQLAKEIPKLYQVEHPEVDKPLGADEMLPIFIFVLVMAEIPDLIALNHELQALCDPDKRLSETGYYLATFEASLSHILEADVNEFSDLLFHPQEGDAPVEESSPLPYSGTAAAAAAAGEAGGEEQSAASTAAADNLQRAKELHEENERKYKESFKKARTVRLILQKL